MRRIRRATLALGAAGLLGICAPGGGGSLARHPDDEVARILATASRTWVQACVDDAEYSVRIYITPDPREEGETSLIDYCPQRRAWIAVSTCGRNRRVALYEIPSRCAWEAGSGGVVGAGVRNAVSGPVHVTVSCSCPMGPSPEDDSSETWELSVDVERARVLEHTARGRRP